jgi:hypothetical protein
MAAPGGKAAPRPAPKPGPKSSKSGPKTGAGPASSSPWAFLSSPRGILAIACAVAAVVVYLVAFGPFSSTQLPEATRTPGYGSPLASAPNLVCGDREVRTEAVSVAGATLDELALAGREHVGGSDARRSVVYQISLDPPDLATAKTSIITWRAPDDADPLIQLSATKANGTGWQLASISTCR